MAHPSWFIPLLMVALSGSGAEAFWWPFSSGEKEETQPSAAVQAPPSGPVAFEMNSAEQKFLAEAQEILNLPPLEACQHQVRPLSHVMFPPAKAQCSIRWCGT